MRLHEHYLNIRPTMKLLVSSFLFLAIFYAVLCQDSSSSGVVFCYYGNWANEREGNGRFGVSDLPVDLCTHLVYSFIYPTPTGALRFDEEKTVEGKSNSVDEFIALKESNSDLKLLVSIGGWDESSANFTIVVNNDNLRATFVSNLLSYIEEKGFDGLDLNWVYPAQRGGANTDKVQFITLLQELKEAFEPNGYLLTASVAVTQIHIDQSYDVPSMNEYLDYIKLMAYDYHGSWNTVTGAVAPLYAQETDSETFNSNVNNSVNIWISNGASPSKLVLGVPLYGRTFTLSDASNSNTGDSVTGIGAAGPYTAEAGFYSYLEILEAQNNDSTSTWEIIEIANSYVYASNDNFWVGYDNSNTAYEKGAYAKTMGLGGIMFWAVDYEDYEGLYGTTFSLIKKGIEGYNSV